MFTGIVQALATVAAITERTGLRTFTLAFPAGFCNGLEIGASVSCDGVCLTVTGLHADDRADFDVMQQPWMRYIFAKGYIAINGASLTVAEADRQEGWFEVWLIPETLRMTTFGEKALGAELNIEIERSTQVMVDTVRDAVAEKLGPLMPALEKLLAGKL